MPALRPLLCILCSKEQIAFESEQMDYFLDFGTDSFAESLSYFPQNDDL